MCPDLNCLSIMMSFLTYITGFFMKFELCKWFQTRRFLWEFPIGSYVKLSSAVGAILVEGTRVVPFQNYVWHFRPLTKMATTAELNLT
jgi:hypothetical protein